LRFLPFKLSEKPPDHIDDNGQEHTHQQHRYYREIKTGIAPFRPDITRQPSEPVQLIVQEKNKDAYDNNANADENDVFACILIHLYNFRNAFRLHI
jgi:hypothetical protein